MKPPFWTWPAAFLLAGLVVGGSVASTLSVEPTARVYFFGLGRLDDRALAPRTVVIIGSSKTRCAVEPDALLNARLAALGSDLRTVRLVRDQATAADFPEVFAAVVRAAPRLVVIETDLLIYEPNIHRRLGGAPRRDWRQRVRDAASFRLGVGSFDAEAAENRVRSRERTCRYNGGGDDGARPKALASRSASSVADRAAYVQFFRELEAVGTLVALSRQPSRGDPADRMPVAIVAAGEQVRRDLVTGAAIIDLGDPVQLDRTAFYDAGHLTLAGRARYSEWLADRVVAVMS